MIASVLTSFWGVSPVATTTPARSKPRSSPVFIGDAVQPWGCDTMLLEILHRDRETNQSDE